MEFNEKYNNKIRNISMILFIIFQLMLTFAVPILKKINNQFLIDNANFICYSILFIIFVFVYKNVMIHSLKKIDKNKFQYLGKYLILTIFSMVVIAIVIDKLGITNTNESVVFGTNRVLDFLTVVIFGTFVEELIFRYFIFRETLKVNTLFAHIFSALVFAFSHVWYYVFVYGDYTQLISMLTYIVLGLNASLLYSKTRNIYYPLFLHMIINLISFTG